MCGMATWRGWRGAACWWFCFGLSRWFGCCGRALRLDQEVLADVAAADRSGRQQYAEQLVAWARELTARPRPLLPAALGLWEGPSQLRRRVAVLLDERLNIARRCPRAWAVSVTVLLVALAAALSIATVEPKSVARAAANDANSQPEVQHTVTAGAVSDVFVAGNPATPWDYKPNVMAISVEDEAGKPLEGVEAIVYRLSRATGEHAVVKRAPDQFAG